MGLLSRMFSREGVPSKEIAKERLKLVLVHDRANIAPQFLQAVKDELLAVISNYLDIDVHGLDVKLTGTGSSVVLIASVPVKRVKRTAKLPGMGGA